jgi:hypothetical protein
MGAKGAKSYRDVQKRANSKSSRSKLFFGGKKSREASRDFLTKMVHVKSSVMIGHFSKELLYPKFQIQI